MNKKTDIISTAWTPRVVAMSLQGQRGFGMIEVMVAVLVLAVGVMGFAGLQSRAVQSSGDSYYRTQANAIAQDLAERVRVNNSQKAYYLTATLWPTTDQTTVPDACRTAACAPQALADFDAAIIRYNAQTLLPQGLVKMEQCQASAVNCIYVSWNGTQPTTGAGGQCVGANGKYVLGANCVMMEVL